MWVGRNELWILSGSQGTLIALSSQHLHLFPHYNLSHHGTPAVLVCRTVLQQLEQSLGLSQVSSQPYHWWVIDFKLSQSGFLYFSFSEAEKLFPGFFPTSPWDEDVCKDWHIDTWYPETWKKIMLFDVEALFLLFFGRGCKWRYGGDIVPHSLPHWAKMPPLQTRWQLQKRCAILWLKKGLMLRPKVRNLQIRRLESLIFARS